MCVQDSSMRKISDVWTAIDDQRPADMPERQWRRSFDGVKAGLKHVGFELVTTSQKFQDLAIPLRSGHGKNYNAREVIVTRAGHTSEPTQIAFLLSGHSGVLTDDERLTIHQRVGVALSAKQLKGIAIYHKAESCAVDELDALLGTADVLQRQHLYEFRLADIAYCLKELYHLAQAVWVGEQIKHAVADKNGQCHFCCAETYMTVDSMISYLKAGLSLTCIGKNTDGKVDVVWFFHGQYDIDLLNQFDPKQTFQPILHLKIKSSNKFTKVYNTKEHRYDVGSSSDECKRLLDRKLSTIRIGVKRTLTYLNEDDSQIPQQNQRLEQRAFALTRAACARIEIVASRISEDAYGPVDFRIGNIARNQDKVFGGQVCMRSAGGLPYNPDNIDIFQLTDLHKQQIYALPMRLEEEDGKIVSFFSETALMRRMLTCSAAWKEANEKYLHDLKDEAGIQAYVDACIAASQVPQLTDREWYSNMLTANAQKFGSKKQIKARKAAAKAAEAEDTADELA